MNIILEHGWKVFRTQHLFTAWSADYWVPPGGCEWLSRCLGAVLYAFIWCMLPRFRLLGFKVTSFRRLWWKHYLPQLFQGLVFKSKSSSNLMTLWPAWLNILIALCLKREAREALVSVFLIYTEKKPIVTSFLRESTARKVFSTAERSAKTWYQVNESFEIKIVAII